MSSLTVRRVQTRQDMRAFLEVPRSIYQDDPHWVRPLSAEVKTRLNPKKNPYFQHANVAMFVAHRGEVAVGRITAQVCELTQQHQGLGTGHFGFFEADDSSETATALFHSAQEWLRDQGMTRMVGPFNLSINEEAGLLVDGFHRPPFIFMSHNPAYYEGLFTGQGLTKEIDVYAYYLDISQPYPARIERIMRAASRDTQITLRNVDKQNLEKELNLLLELFNDSWADNWGHVPMTTPEVDDLAMLVRRLFTTDAVVLAEIDGQCAGFIVVIPNLNELTADFDGKLFPINWMKLMYRLQRRQCTSVRVPLMGIARKYQSTRTGAAIAFSMIDRCRRASVEKGAIHCEMSWILESNQAMRSILDASGSVLDKTYRLFSKAI
ncbi:N-acetyltransferase [Neorhodopirellula pilleata]|uniref:N-acetyltransferase domain-containing protein n=1 Tax=Neorhodopirellula pilleata TaxID=2714738 RepID=A0A5C6A143_9BACT|nr:N-acetyltransferase [Neorhodopirellula pilleata]TWT93030.1 hypothetical protein Pla100_43460 [Neorhodopirellula pilleata]